MEHRAQAGIKKCFLGSVRLYQRWISPCLPPRCRFYPTCSEYAALCLQQESVTRACIKISLRVAKCNPFHPGGVDIP